MVYQVSCKGIELVVRDPQNVPPATVILANTLKQAGIPFSAARNPNIAIGVTEFRIGAKQ